MSTKSEIRIEFFVGFFVAFVLAGLAFFTIVVSGATFFRDTKFKIEAVMPDAMGLRRNDTVIAKGTTVGSVEKVFYDRDGVHVTAILDAPVAFHEGYRVTVVSSSILGGRQLVIYEGDPSAPEVKDLMKLVGQRPADLMEDATEAVRKVRDFLETDTLGNLENFTKNISEISDRLNYGEGSLGKLLSDDDSIYVSLELAAADLRDVIADFKSITARLAAGEGTIGKLLSSDETLYNDLAGAVADARHALSDIRLITTRLESGEGSLGKLLSSDDTIYTDLSTTIANLNTITTRLEAGEGTLGKLLSSDDTVYQDLAGTIANFNTISTRLEAGEGTLGKLLSSDSSMYDNLDGAIRDARETLDDLREASTLTTVMTLLFSGF